jgi:hypothetical protein
MPDLDVHEIIALILKEDSRFDRQAYAFVRDDYALDQFGPLAKTVLNAWGLSQTIHFGDIVYNFIEYNVFSKTDSDRREDFADVYSFDEAFDSPFRPRARRLPLPSLAEAE